MYLCGEILENGLRCFIPKIEVCGPEFVRMVAYFIVRQTVPQTEADYLH